MFVSDVVKQNEPQLVRRIYDMSKSHADVVDLTLGDPDIPTPDVVKKATCAAFSTNSKED